MITTQLMNVSGTFFLRPFPTAVWRQLRHFKPIIHALLFRSKVWMKIFFETKAVLGNRLNDVKCLIENYCMEAALRNWNAFTVIWIYSWMYVTSILFEESSSPKFFKKIISIFFVLKKKWHVRLSCQRPQATGVAERGGGWLNIETGTHTHRCALYEL